MTPIPPQPHGAHLPLPPSERRAWLLACALAALGVAVLIAVLSGAVGQKSALSPPPVGLAQATPAPAPTGPAARNGAPGTPAHTAPAPRGALRAGLAGAPSGASEIARSWMEGFYPIYATAQATFGVNWLLLASIHKQESAFSTASGTYHGLNFAHCCGGPMQFNVTNGRVTTWDLVSNSYIYATRPAAYGHMTSAHPSIYDDFDAIMAASHLLSADGAGYALDGSAWNAAYDYYGHDATGVAYADEVLARAIGWSQHGFCINCGVEGPMLAAVDAAYGAPVLAALSAPPRARLARAAAAGR